MTDGGTPAMKLTSRRIGVAAAALAATLVLSACVPTSTPDDDTSITVALPGSLSNLYVGQENGILNYYIASIAQEGLVTLDAEGEIQPALAESWEQVDPETIVFHLRQGVRWHDIPPVNGREFVADDVVYTLQRNYGAGVEGDGLAIAWGNINAITSVEARDKYTVVIKGPPDVDRLHDLLVNAHQQDIIAREAVEEFGSLAGWETQIGTGPWIAGVFQVHKSISPG